MADHKDETGETIREDIDQLLRELKERPANVDEASPGGARAETVKRIPLFVDESPPASSDPAEKRGAAVPSRAAGEDIEFLLDIPLQVSVEAGRARMTISELLSLGPGSIVKLEKRVGEPLDVFINQKLIARGEIVIINEKFGIRLTEIVSRPERIAHLKT